MGKICGFILITLSCYPMLLSGNKINSNELVGLSEYEIKQSINLLRNTQFFDNLAFEFEIEHSQDGSYNRTKYTGRFDFNSDHESDDRRLIIENKNGLIADYKFEYGKELVVWKKTEETLEYCLQLDTEKFNPLNSNIILCPIDIFMPYLKFENISYRGPRFFGTRNLVHDFVIDISKDKTYEDSEIDIIIVTVDPKYKIIREINYYFKNALQKTITLKGIKKVNSFWIVSRLTFRDHLNKQSNLFRIKNVKN